MTSREVDEDILNVVASELSEEKKKILFSCIKKYEEKIEALRQEAAAERERHNDKIESKNKTIFDLNFQLGMAKGNGDIAKMLLKELEDKSKEVKDKSCELKRLKVDKGELEKKYIKASVFPYLRHRIEMAEALYILPLEEVPKDFTPKMMVEENALITKAKSMLPQLDNVEAEELNSAFYSLKFNKHYLTWMFICEHSPHEAVKSLRTRLKEKGEDYMSRAASFSADMAVLSVMTSTMIHPPMIPHLMWTRSLIRFRVAVFSIHRHP